MMRSLLSVFCFSLILSFSSFAEDSQRPGWVDGHGRDEFPEEKYVIAVGSGKDRKAAEADAKRALAERFRSKVSADTESNEKDELSEDTDAKVSGKSNGQTKTSLKISTSIELKGVEILRRYHDTGTNEDYALAGIDRLKVRSAYSMSLMQRKKRIDSLVAGFDAKPSVAKGKKILAEIEAFEQLSEEAEGVGAGMPVSEILADEKRDQIENRMEELQSQNLVNLKVQGGEENDVGDLLGSCLTDEGASLAGDGDEKAKKVSVKYSEKNKKIKVEGWEKIEFTLAIESPGIKKKVVSQTGNARGKEQAFDQVREKLIKQACDHIINAVSK